MMLRSARRGALLTTGVLLVASLFAPASLASAEPAEAGASAVCTTVPRIEGSFIQPSLAAGWSDAQLRAEFTALMDACITSQVLQLTADSKASTTVYPSGLKGYRQSTSNDVVSRVLTAADAAGVAEYVGLQKNADWWTNHANSSGWLQAEAATSIALADDIFARYGAHDSFAGWYLPFEVDNWYFRSAESWNNLSAFYKTVADHLHELTPGKPVIISPFYNNKGGQTPAQWAAMWSAILRVAPIDVIAPQDGAGAAHTTPGQMADWFAATKDAIASARPATQLWANSETYGPGYVPLPIGQIVENMTAVAPYVSKTLSFSYDHYQSPLVVPPAFDATYRSYLSTGAVETSPPTVPARLLAAPASESVIQVSWSASTDDHGVVGYNLYRDGVLVTAIRGTQTTFADTGLTPETTYSYTVTAFDAAGNHSASSLPADATTKSLPLSLGAPYTASVEAHERYPDTGGTELTDGVSGSEKYTDPAWQGRLTSSPYSFTIDLGAARTITEVESTWLQRKSVTIYLPKSVRVEVSSDGTTFTPLATISAPSPSDADLRHTFRADGLNDEGRYVRFTVTPDGKRFSFVDQATVRGS